MPLPIIDMDLHAMTADAQGQPPLAFDLPVREWPVHDPVFIRWMKEPRGEWAVWSPMTG